MSGWIDSNQASEQASEQGSRHGVIMSEYEKWTASKKCLYKAKDAYHIYIYTHFWTCFWSADWIHTGYIHPDRSCLYEYNHEI